MPSASGQFLEGLAQIIKALIGLVFWVVGGVVDAFEPGEESDEKAKTKPRRKVRRKAPVTAHWNRAEERRLRRRKAQLQQGSGPVTAPVPRLPQRQREIDIDGSGVITTPNVAVEGISAETAPDGRPW